jgi:hypothetical protein
MIMEAIGSIGPGLLRRNLHPLLTLTDITSARLEMLWCLFYLAINLLLTARRKLYNQ